MSKEDETAKRARLLRQLWIKVRLRLALEMKSTGRTSSARIALKLNCRNGQRLQRGRQLRELLLIPLCILQMGYTVTPI